MAEKTTLARPYAKAIFEFAKQEKAFQKWSDALNVLSLIASEREVIYFLLKDSNVTLDEIVQFFNVVSKKILDENIKNLIVILAKQKRLIVLPEIKMLFEEMRANAENTAKVKLVTAIPLKKEEQATYSNLLQQKYLEGRKIVDLKCELNKDLIGGFVATAGNKVIDASVRCFLNHLQETMGE